MKSELYGRSELQEVQIIRIGRRRTIVIPKKIAEKLNIDEGSYLVLVSYGDRVEIRPLPDAITLSLKGRKIAKITLKELEEESIRVQRQYAGEA